MSDDVTVSDINSILSQDLTPKFLPVIKKDICVAKRGCSVKNLSHWITITRIQTFKCSVLMIIKK